MNWGGFPIGFRFPVQDFSWETKKRCWSYVLPALVYADLTDCTLQEAESAELFDPDRLVYIAVVALFFCHRFYTDRKKLTENENHASLAEA